MILYIAGPPITGLPDHTYAAFRLAGSQLVTAGYEVLNPVDIDVKHNPKGLYQSWSWYMGHAMRMVLDAEGIALLPDWEMSEASNLQIRVATTLKLPIRSASDWVDAAMIVTRDISDEEVNEMKKFGTGQVTQTEGPLSKTASAQDAWTQGDQQELAVENDDADQPVEQAEQDQQTDKG